MKLIVGFLMFVAAVAVIGGLYLAIRKPEQKKADLERLGSVSSQIANRLQQLGDSLVRLYSITVAKVIPGARKLKMVVIKLREESNEEIMMMAIEMSHMVWPSWAMSDKGE